MQSGAAGCPRAKQYCDAAEQRCAVEQMRQARHRPEFRSIDPSDDHLPVGELQQAAKIVVMHRGHQTLRDKADRSEEHTSELQSLRHLVCRLLLEKKKKKK